MLEVLGKAKTIKVSKEETTIIDGAGDPAGVKEQWLKLKLKLPILDLQL